MKIWSVPHSDVGIDTSEIPCRVRQGHLFGGVELALYGGDSIRTPAHNGEALVATATGNAVGSPLPSDGYDPVTTEPFGARRRCCYTRNSGCRYGKSIAGAIRGLSHSKSFTFVPIRYKGLSRRWRDEGIVYAPGNRGGT